MIEVDHHEESRPMGRPPLNLQATTIRFSKELLARIDALVGEKQRATFIREAVEARLKYAEELKSLGNHQDKR